MKMNKEEKEENQVEVHVCILLVISVCTSELLFFHCIVKTPSL